MTHRLLARHITPGVPNYWPHRYFRSCELDTTTPEHLTYQVTETQRRKMIISMWVRFTRKVGTDNEVPLWMSYAADSAWGGFFIDVNGYLTYQNRASGSTNGLVYAQRSGWRLKFSDHAWYHFIFSLDPDNATTSERLNWYCNGLWMGRDESNAINAGDQRYGVIGDTVYIGAFKYGTDHFLDGYLYDIRIAPGVCLQDGVIPITEFGNWADIYSGRWQASQADWTKLGSAADRLHLTFDDVNNILGDQSGAGTVVTGVGTPAAKYEVPWSAHSLWQHNHNLDETNITTRRYGMRRTGFGATSAQTYHVGTVAFDPKLSSRGFGFHIRFYAPLATTALIGVINSQGQTCHWKADGSTSGLGGATIGTGFVADDEVGCLVDLENFRLKFYKNGVAQGTGWYTMNIGINKDLAFAPRWGGGANHASFYRAGFSTFEPALADFKTVKSSKHSQRELLPVSNTPILSVKPHDMYHEVEYTGNGLDYHKISIPWDCSGADGNTMIWITQVGVVQQKTIYTNILPSKRIMLSAPDAMITAGDVLAWTKDGVELGENAIVNANGGTFILQAFHMKPEYGMTIQTFEGNATARNIAHGNNYTPKMYWIKNLDDVTNKYWMAYHKKLHDTAPEDYAFYVNQTATYGRFSTTAWDSTQPDATNVRVSSAAAVNGNGDTCLLITMAPVPGISELDVWISNDLANNVLVPLGFRPTFKLWTSRNIIGNAIVNTWGKVRNTLNPVQEWGVISETGQPGSGAEYALFFANGFKITAPYTGQECVYWVIGDCGIRGALGR